MNLSFTDIRAKNVKRSEKDWKHNLKAWSIAEWGCAMAGEAGEACNVAKKILRCDHDVRAELAGKSRDGYIQELADELADTFLYIDLMAARAGINLELAIINKFNKKSKDTGSKIML
jgi:NTP pyrophosphatase (non-canonical NTP hydrolase)